MCVSPSRPQLFVFLAADVVFVLFFCNCDLCFATNVVMRILYEAPNVSSLDFLYTMNDWICAACYPVFRP